MQQITSAAVSVQAGADVVMERTRVIECGVAVFAPGVSVVRMRDVHLVSCGFCDAAVRVGDDTEDSGMSCCVCGRHGEVGPSAALAAARASEWRGVVGARCVHEGGLAVVSMQRVLLEGAKFAVVSPSRATHMRVTCAWRNAVARPVCRDRLNLLRRAPRCGHSCGPWAAPWSPV